MTILSNLQSPQARPSPSPRGEAGPGSAALARRLEDAKRGIGGGGLALDARLRQVRLRYNIHPNPSPLPLAEPIDAQSIKIRGYAATADVDLDRGRFRPDCWPVLDPSRIKLLMNHDPTKEVGRIDEVTVDARGRVTIVATVTDPLAMRQPALSISASVGKFTIERPDSATFVGEVEQVTDINETSLTRTPSNPRAVVLERWVPSPVELLRPGAH